MKTLESYSHIRGVNHRVVTDPKILERDLGFCNRLGINSTRVWLAMKWWEENPKEYLAGVKKYVQESWKKGVSTMPIIWNGNYMTDPSVFIEDDWVKIDQYIADVVAALKDEEGLLIWDIINEPACTDWIYDAPEDIKQQRFDILWAFVKRLCDIVRKHDKKNAICIGHVIAEFNDVTHDWVDVLCFHDYRTTRKKIKNHYKMADDMSKRYGKPMMQTETGCICRSNPYDIQLEMCNEFNMGWYLFNLIIEGPWSDVHGIVYPDGTVRDPAIVAAIGGFFRKRSTGRILPNPNREGHAYRAIHAVEDVLLTIKAAQHRQLKRTTNEILEAAEYCVNLLETAEMVPMWDAPSARIEEWRAMPEEQRNIHEISKFAYDMANLLKESCLIGTVPEMNIRLPEDSDN